MKKIYKNRQGFTLTEVMIGMTILTIAIVSATSLLVGLIGSNQNNLQTLQAHYLAVEGIEAVRNIRDTNWLHNRDWLGDVSGAPWGQHFIVPNSQGEENLYSVNLEASGFSQDLRESVINDLTGLSAAKTWNIGAPEQGGIFLSSDLPRFFSGRGESDTGFKRVIAIEAYDCDEDDCSDYALVTSKVTWTLGSKEREVSISEVLTNWKGGAL